MEPELARHTPTDTPPVATAPATPPAPAAAPRTHAPRILVAEDDAAMRALIAEVLQRRGYDVVERPDGATALQELSVLWEETRYQRPPVDMVISDVRMPGVSGMSIAAGLRELIPSLPIVLITAFGSAETHAQARSLGVTAMFDKPFDLEDLLAVVSRALPAL